MIVFKMCPRCGGDVDTTFQDDVFCIQCGCRPPGIPLASENPAARQSSNQPGQYGHTKVSAHRQEEVFDSCGILCPRCDSDSLVRLEKLRTLDNTCYRCRRCGHIFSPRVEGLPERSGAVLS